MTQISLRIEDGEVKLSLQKAQLAVRNLPDKIIWPIMTEAREEIQTYPEELPEQKYIRTGNRYRATRVQKEGGAFRMISDPRYKYGRTGNPYVLGDATGGGQAPIHRNRWHLMFVVMRNAVEEILIKGEEYFRAVLERNGAP